MLERTQAGGGETGGPTNKCESVRIGSSITHVPERVPAASVAAGLNELLPLNDTKTEAIKWEATFSDGPQPFERACPVSRGHDDHSFIPLQTQSGEPRRLTNKMSRHRVRHDCIMGSSFAPTRITIMRLRLTDMYERKLWL